MTFMQEKFLFFCHPFHCFTYLLSDSIFYQYHRWRVSLARIPRLLSPAPSFLKKLVAIDNTDCPSYFVLLGQEHFVQTSDMAMNTSTRGAGINGSNDWTLKNNPSCSSPLVTVLSRED